MTSSKDRTPLEIVKTFVAGIKKRDLDGMLSLCHENVNGCLIRNGEPVYKHMSEVLAPMRTLPASVYLEEVTFDEIVHEHGDFAIVWAPYRFYRPEEGKVQHEGSNSFSLWKHPDRGWIITAISDIAIFL